MSSEKSLIRLNAGCHRRRFFSVLVFIVGLAVLPSIQAGGFIFAGEDNGVDLIIHPQGYTGTETALTIEVCIDPASNIPANATSLDDLEQSAKNVVATWNKLSPRVGNVLLGAENDLTASQLDFESILLHEVGHCLGLSHVNAATESGLPGSDANYTKATNGVDNMFNINPGSDGIKGSQDDVRGDDVNLHWFRKDTNDPGELPLPSPLDATTYDRDLSSLPSGQNYAANLDRDVAGTLGHPNSATVRTEAVMQQGTFADEAQRELSADDVATLRLAASGTDETAGTLDDYSLTLVYGGISSASSCDMTMDFEPSASVGLAFCSIGGEFIGPNHGRITTAFMKFGQDFNWFFNQQAADLDSDGVPDAIDNCVNITNPDQADNGGVDTDTVDGIGDLCQCGDMNGDGKVTNSDAVLIKRHLLGLPSPFNAALCDVNGDSNCSNTDAVIIKRVLLGLPPGVAQVCDAAIP